MIRAGKWTLSIASPHPMWCTLTYGDEGGPWQQIHTVHHQDLRDLQYAIKRAIVEARNNLSPADKHQMD